MTTSVAGLLTPSEVTEKHCTNKIDASQENHQTGFAYSWPTWARTARIAGAYFAPGNSAAALSARLDALAAQQVSVVLADSPWGQQYAVWANDKKFVAVRQVIAKVVQKAHARGLKVVLYQTGLELLANPTRNPGKEHPEWAQVALDGTPLLFNNIRQEETHWLQKGIWDLWVSPATFQTYALARVRAMVATGIDGLWVDQVYLQSSVGDHHELWPSSDPCSAAAFTRATGLPLPTVVDWDNPVFQRWVLWRHDQLADFLLAIKAAARAVNPNLVFFNENSSVDTGRATYVGNDPTRYLAYPDMSTGHEVETIADRMDRGETGMKGATLDQWLSFRTMIAFARGADVGKPSWILTYGYEPRDSAQLAGLVLAEGANFYETKGPQMADTVGDAFRTQLFAWIADHEDAFYASESAAEVGLLYSPRTRDLLDTVSGEPYDIQNSIHFAAYRAVANLLYRAHIPFDVVIDTNLAAFARYRVLIAPEIQSMGDLTLALLETFAGTVISTGATGRYDEWLTWRACAVLTGAKRVQLEAVGDNILCKANTHLLTTDAPPAMQLGLRRHTTGYTLVVVNTATTPTATATVTLRLQQQEVVTDIQFAPLNASRGTLNFTQAPDEATVQLMLPSGIETVAVVNVAVTPAGWSS
ncbi:MAG: hypothetical protein R3C14_52115 [Caldilineaceae bacterium]